MLSEGPSGITELNGRSDPIRARWHHPYLLNYVPGLDLERRDAFGFRALLKAARQGPADCIRALMLTGVMSARGTRRGTSRQAWALTRPPHAQALERPCPERFPEKYQPELPSALRQRGNPRAPGTACRGSGTASVRADAALPAGPEGPRRPGPSGQDDQEPLTAPPWTSCPTVCPESPPCAGKRRLPVQEIPEARGPQAEEAGEAEGAARRIAEQRRVLGGLPSSRPPARSSAGVRGSRRPAPRKPSLLLLRRLRRSSVRPGVLVPRVGLSQALTPTFQPEGTARKGSTRTAATYGSGDLTRRPRRRS
ncbi:Ankyrin repeat domain-containing protein 33B [Plecturocebus cupreus]